MDTSESFLNDTLPAIVGLGEALMTRSAILNEYPELTEDEMRIMSQALDIIRNKRRELIR